MQEFMNGVKLATTSLVLIWYDFYLMVFLSIPLVLTVIIDVLNYNILLTRGDNEVIASMGLNQLLNALLRGPHWLHIVGGICFLFFKTFIGLLFTAALIIYASAECQGQSISFKHSFTRLYSHLTLLLYWALITTGQALLLSHTFTDGYPLQVRIVGMLISSIWYLATWLVLPLIVVEQHPIRQAMIKSALLVLNHVPLVIGGAVWLLGLSIVPTFFFDLLTMLANGSPWGPSMIMGILILLVSLKSYILTAETLFKTMVYQQIR